LKESKLNIEFVVEKTAPTTDQLRKKRELFDRLFKKQKNAGGSAQEKQDNGTRIYKTCGWLVVGTNRKQSKKQKRSDDRFYMKGSMLNVFRYGNWKTRYSANRIGTFSELGVNG
jgi:hypothetical protein